LEVSLELGPARRSIDYTEEALRVLEGGEKSLRERVEEGVRGAY